MTFLSQIVKDLEEFHHPDVILVSIVNRLRASIVRAGVKEEDIHTKVTMVWQGIMIEVYGEAK